MMIGRIAAGLMLACCSCNSAPLKQDNVKSITYTLSECLGTCPSFSLVASDDGKGVYYGRYYVAEVGKHNFRFTKDQFVRFRDRLKTALPDSDVEYGYENCDGEMWTDNPSVSIAWEKRDGSVVNFNWDLGCKQPQLLKHQDQIYEAWKELPVAELVGRDELRGEYQGY